MRKIFLILCAVAMILLVAFAVVQLIVVGGTRSSIFSADDVPAAYAVIVPGASVLRNGTPSDILADRLTVAANIYAAGKAEKILVSGDNGQDGYDEVNVMRRFLLGKDVAPEDIFLDHAGFDTYDTMYRARNVFGITDAIVVTQRYHLYRALFVASNLGIAATGVASNLQPYVKQAWFSARETLSRVKAVGDVLFGSVPRYIGDPIDIRGDGRVTWD
jgi:vancomycin permeability regulator SanA